MVVEGTKALVLLLIVGLMIGALVILIVAAVVGKVREFRRIAEAEIKSRQITPEEIQRLFPRACRITGAVWAIIGLLKIAGNVGLVVYGAYFKANRPVEFRTSDWLLIGLNILLGLALLAAGFMALRESARSILAGIGIAVVNNIHQGPGWQGDRA